MLGVDGEEVGAWRQAAEEMHVPYDGILDVHMQSEGFTHHDVCDKNPWFEPLSTKAGALHPNATGTQRMAKLLRAAVGAPPN